MRALRGLRARRALTVGSAVVLAGAGTLGGIAATAIPAAAIGANRYVATTGSDSANDCTNSASHCLTIAHAVSVAGSGDVIDVAAGEYDITDTITVDSSLTITGAGAATTTVKQTGPNRVFFIDGSASITGLTITGGTQSDGAGIYVFETGSVPLLSGDVITANTASRRGGGIFVDGGGSIGTLTNDTISSNSAGADGGGIDNMGTITTLSNDTIVNNTAASADGGGIANENAFDAGFFITPSPTIINLVNDTISNNTALRGGGIFNGETTTTGGPTIPTITAMTNDTIAANTATVAGDGGGLFVNQGTVAVAGTILAANSSFNCGGATPVDHGYNLEDSSPSTCSFTSANHDVVGQNPQLGALADNGGPTKTEALSADSPALHVDASGCPATDQRGVSRPQPSSPSGCDIGAYELVPVVADDAYVAAANTPLHVAAPGVLGNDSDGSLGGTLTAALVTGPAHGSLSFNADGSFTYTSAGTFTGTDTFTYSATDTQGFVSGTATVTITIGSQRYVATTGSDTTPGPSNDCTNPATPCLTIAHAVGVAGLGDTIHVASGVYPITSTIIIPSTANLTIAGAGAATTTVKETATTATTTDTGVFEVVIGGTASITGLTITGGNQLQEGGGVLNEGTIPNLTGDVITGNNGGGTGGGVINKGTITTLSNNVISDNQSGNGGGIDNFGSQGFVGVITTFTNNTITGNTVVTGGGGGGVSNEGGTITTFSGNTISGNTAGTGGGVFTDSDLTLTNNTITGNTANTAGGPGGGGVASIAPHLTLVNDTINGNTAPAGTGGGLDVFRSGTVVSGGTILAGNTGGNCAASVNTDNGYNLDDVSPSTCGFTTPNHDVVGHDPQLGALANNGGPTQTEALSSDSPALHVEVAGCPSTDQRGVPRPQPSTAPGCDIGAYELLPIVADDAYTTLKDTPLSPPHPGVLGNDSDGSLAGTLTATLVSGPAHGSLTFNSDGSFTYTPANAYTGTDSFTYTAADTQGFVSGVATVTITVQSPDADLSVTKTGTPPSTTPGSNVTYTVTVANAGPQTAESASMSDALPAGTTLVSVAAPGGWSCPSPSVAPGFNGTVKCTTPSFAVNTTGVVFTIVVHVSPNFTGQLSNAASVTSSTPDSNSANNTSSPPVITQVGCDHTQGSTGGSVTLGAGSTC